MAEAERLGIDPSKIRAWYSPKTDKIYINAGKVRPSEVPYLLLHEAAVHKGLPGVLGKQYDSVMDSIYGQFRKEIEAVNELYHYDLENEGERRAATEEYLAERAEFGGHDWRAYEKEHFDEVERYIAENGLSPENRRGAVRGLMAENGDLELRPSRWKEFLQKVKMFFRKWKGFEDYRFTDEEIETLIMRGLRKAKGRNKPDRLDRLDRFAVGGEEGARRMRDAEERLSNLAIAKQMAEDGKDAHAIKLTTGWEKGGDGKWRFELPDLAPKKGWEYILLAKKNAVLRDIVDAKELFEAYPELAKTPVRTAIFRDEAGNDQDSVFGMYDDEADSFFISAQNIAKFELTDFWETLVHEVQHKIQRIEGFARGGNPQMFPGKSEALKAEVEAFRKKADTSEKYRRMEELDREFGKIFATGTDEEVDAWNEKFGQEYDALENDPEVKSIKEEKSDILKRYGNNLRVLEVLKDPGNEKSWEAIALDDDLYKKTQYRRLAGEVEARNVQNRLYLSSKQRLEKLLADTADVAPEDMIYLEKAVESMMSPLRPENAPNNAENGKALRDNDVPHHKDFMEWAGLKGKYLYADYEFLYAKHWNKDGKSPYFNSQEEVRAAVELVLSAPEKVQDVNNNLSFVGKDMETGKIYRIEIQQKVKASSNHIRSVFEITPVQYEKCKLESSPVLQLSPTGDSAGRTLSSFLRYDTPDSGKVKGDSEKNASFSVEDKPVVRLETEETEDGTQEELEEKRQTALSDTLNATGFYGNSFAEEFGPEWSEYSEEERQQYINESYDQDAEEKSADARRKNREERDLALYEALERCLDLTAEYAESLGYEVGKRTINSGATSGYLEVETPDGDEVFHLRISDHGQPSGGSFLTDRYGNSGRQKADYSVVMKDDAFDLAGLLDFLRSKADRQGERIGTDENGNAKFSVDQTETEAFKRWFGDSKVVDDEGNPLVVYHGTNAEFNIFDMDKTRSNMDIHGAFFSPWEDDAAGYGWNIRAFYLNIRNPADEATAYKALNMFKGQNDAGVKARDYLIQQGYDGVNLGNQEYIAFYPNQIKSATDNIGPFDPENPDVRFSVESYSEEDWANMVTFMKPYVGLKIKHSPEECLKYLRDNGFDVASESDAQIIAAEALKANQRDQRAAGRKAMFDWLILNDFWFGRIYDAIGKTDFLIRPSHRFVGEDFTGSYISPEFVKYSGKLKVKDKEAKLAKAKGYHSDELAKLIAAKTGGDELEIEQDLIDYFRHLKKT